MADAKKVKMASCSVLPLSMKDETAKPPLVLQPERSVLDDAKKEKKMASSSSVVPLSMEMEDDTPVLQVTVEDSIAMDKKKKKKPSAPPPPPASRLVDKAKKKLLGLPCSFFAVKFSCLLALFSAALLGASAGKSLKNTPCDPKVVSRWCIELTDAAGAMVLGLERGQLWVSGAQAAFALAGLLLTGRRRSRAFGFVALTVGALNLCMEAVVGSTFIAAAPGNHSLKDAEIHFLVCFAVLDFMGLVSLILGRDEDEY